MNDLKQFFATTTGKIISIVVILGTGVFISTHSLSKTQPIEQPQTVVVAPIVTPNVVIPPITPVVINPVQLAQKKTVVVNQYSKTTQLPKSDPVSLPPPQVSASNISGLSSIRVSGGIWDNWNADMANDGPFIEIVYLDSLGNIIGNNSTEQLPISADVKVYTKDTTSFPYKEGRLAFSAHYSTSQIILGNIYPKIRIPKEQISVNPAVDYQYGYVSVTIHTPTQGDFSSESDFIELYE